MISVVIPVYNGEKYIKNAFMSVVNQTYRDIELVIVNDGSTDGTLQLLEELWDKYKPKGKIISIPNAGVSNARNVGFSNITGDFFCQLDADDYLETDIFERIFEQNTDFDVCYYGFRAVDSRNNFLSSYEDDFEYIKDLSGIEGAIAKLKKDIWICVGSAVYNRRLIVEKGLMYATDIRQGEDLLFISSALIYSRIVTCVNGIGVNILERPDSAMHSKYNASFHESIEAAERLRKIALNLDSSNLLNSTLQKLCSVQIMDQICYVAKKIISSDEISFMAKYKLLSILPKSEFDNININRKSLNREKFIEFSVFKYSVLMYYFIVFLYFHR